MLVDRVLKILTYFKRSKASCAKEFKISQTTFNDHLTPANEDKVWQYLPKILEWYPSVSREWLYFGEGSMLAPLGGNSAPSLLPATSTECRDICDTLVNYTGVLAEPLFKIAEVAGMSTEELTSCLHARSVPPSVAICRWIHRYKINANFLLAQVGEPFLSDEEYYKTNALFRVREKRGDFIPLDNMDEVKSDMETAFSKERDELEDKIDDLRKDLKRARARLDDANDELRALHLECRKLLTTNADLRVQLASHGVTDLIGEEKCEGMEGVPIQNNAPGRSIPGA